MEAAWRRNAAQRWNLTFDEVDTAIVSLRFEHVPHAVIETAREGVLTPVPEGPLPADLAGTESRSVVDHRDGLHVAYDPDVAALLTEVYGADAWRYRRPEARDAAGTAHLSGFDRAHVPAFVWPPEEVTSAAPQ